MFQTTAKCLFFFCFGLVAAWPQTGQFLPKPMPQVEYLGRLPQVKIETVDFDQVGRFIRSDEKYGANFPNSSPKLIIVQLVVEPSAPESEGVQEKIFPAWYLEKSIWADLAERVKKDLAKHGEPPPTNEGIMNTVKILAECNKIKVAVWKLEGKIEDTKMPKGYPIFLCPDK